MELVVNLIKLFAYHDVVKHEGYVFFSWIVLKELKLEHWESTNHPVLAWFIVVQIRALGVSHTGSQGARIGNTFQKWKSS